MLCAKEEIQEMETKTSHQETEPEFCSRNEG